MQKVLAAGLLAMSFAPLAQAADLGGSRAPVAAVVAAPAFSWTGAYAGVQFGYGWLGGRSTFVDPFGTVGTILPVRSNGVLGGVHLGYNHQFGVAVLGAEADVELSGVRGTVTAFGPLAAGTGVFDQRWQASLRARAGVAVDKALLYVTGGVAFTDFGLGGGPAGFPVRYGASRVGWTVGTGVEYALAPNWTARAEYRYSDYGTVARDIGGIVQRTSLHAHSVRLGVSYRFSTDPSAVVARY